MAGDRSDLALLNEERATGCADAEVASITGQSRQVIEHYSRRVNNKRLAAAAILKRQGAAAKPVDGAA